MASTFAKGDTVFLSDGQEVEYIAGSVGEHVVRPILNDVDDEPHYGRPFTVYEVFVEAPVAKYDERIAKLRAEVEELEAKAKAARTASQDFERGERERRERLRTHDSLQRLDDLLAGRITHAVVAEYCGASIQTFDEVLVYRRDNGREEGLKLLTLFGKSGGDLTWGVNRYYDGSGSNQTIYPACSYEEALEIWTRLWDAAMAEFRTKTGYMHGLNYWIEAGKKVGVELPADVAERWYAHAVASAEEALAKARSDIAKKEKELATRRALFEAAKATPSDTHEVG